MRAALVSAAPSLLERTRVVLLHPFFPENLGAAARAMRNAGLSELVIADPGPVGPDHPNALKLAVMAHDILAKARITPTLDESLAEVSLVIGTSRHVYEGMQTVTPRDAARLAAQHVQGGGRIALLFGNEKNGLSKEELRRCHQVIRIPSASQDTSLNLAQAMMIVAYEWLLAAQEPVIGTSAPLTALALEPAVRAIARDLAIGLEARGFFKPHNRTKKEALLRRVLSRVLLDPEEVSVFRGLAHRMGQLLETLDP